MVLLTSTTDITGDLIFTLETLISNVNPNTSGRMVGRYTFRFGVCGFESASGRDVNSRLKLALRVFN